MNEEIRKEKCHLSCSKQEVQLCWPYIWQTHLPVHLLHTQTCTYICTHTTKCITQAEEEWDFLSSGEGESPSWINPCLRVLVPSPSWIGLDSFLFSSLLFFFFSFFLPSILNEHNSEFPDSSLPLTLVWRWTSDSLLTYRKYIFLYCLIMSLSALPLSPFLPSMLSLSFLSFFCISFFYW